MLGPTLLPIACNIRLIQARSEWNSIALVIATTTVGAKCPCCSGLSRRIHSRYVRHLADAPLRQVQVSVELHVRKFYCDNPGCERSIFVERVAGFAESYARRTVQLDELLRLMAFANGGECGSRVAAEMRITISPQSLLRLIRRQGVEIVACGQVGRVLGIDDWSFAKRKRYGAMIVDWEEHRVVDLLPDRLAETVSAWMTAHPGIEIVARDGGDNFIAGVTQGAPQARQVADRWHLHHNLGDMLKRLVEQHLGELHKLIRGHWRERAQTGASSSNPNHAHFHKIESADERELRERDERYRQRHELVHALAHDGNGDGKSVRDIAKMTGLARETVRSILATATYAGVPQRGPRHSPIDPYHNYIAQRIAAGFVNAELLYKQIQAQGFTGVYSTVWRLVRRLAQQTGQLAAHAVVALADQPRPTSISVNLPSIFEIIQWLMDKQHLLTSEQTESLQHWLAATPAIQAGRDAALRFTEILTLPQPEKLDTWIVEAAAASSAVIKGFAKGIKADYNAILAALQLPWSNAQLEGQINRLKVIKRMMYGRAKFDLLKIRVMTKV